MVKIMFASYGGGWMYSDELRMKKFEPLWRVFSPLSFLGAKSGHSKMGCGEMSH